MDMDFFQPDLQQGGAQGTTLCPRSWPPPKNAASWRSSFLGVVALASTALQLAAVWSDEHHWAKLSPSFAELEGRGEVPWDELEGGEDYDEYILKYDLWNVKEKFCFDTEEDYYIYSYGGAGGRGGRGSGGGGGRGRETGTRRVTYCNSFTTAIEGRGGGADDESCRGRGKQCEDHFAATSTARTTTCVALICAAVVALWFLFVCIRALRLGRGLEASPKAIFGAAAVLAVGGVVGLAGAYNYRSTAAAADDYDEICDWGCAVSLYGGVGAMVVGAAVAAFEARSNAEELRRWSWNDLKEVRWSCIDLKEVPSPDAPALKKAFVRVGLLGLLCAGAHAYALFPFLDLLHWARFDLKLERPGDYLSIRMTYDLNVFDVSMMRSDPTYGYLEEGTWAIDKGKSWCDTAIGASCDCHEYYFDMYGKSCDCGENFCGAVAIATLDARRSGWVALGSAAITGLGSLFAAWRASGWRDKAKTKIFAGFSTLLAVGGVVGLASAVNYRSTMKALGQELNYKAPPETCTSGCLVSLCAGVLAAVGAIGIVVRAIAVTKQRQASAKPSDSVETPSTPPPDPETETEPEAEAEAEAEEPGFMGKLSSFLFGEEEPAVESEGVAVEVPAMRPPAKKARPAPSEPPTDAPFAPADAYDGSRPGYVFKKGDHGLGYYKEELEPES